MFFPGVYSQSKGHGLQVERSFYSSTHDPVRLHLEHFGLAPWCSKDVEKLEGCHEGLLSRAEARVPIPCVRDLDGTGLFYL